MGRQIKELISVSSAGEELGVSLSTMWRMIRRGELQTVRIGGRRLVRRSDLRGKSVRAQPTRSVPFTAGHALWRLAGAYRSGGSGPGSGDKHAILDE